MTSKTVSERVSVETENSNILAQYEGNIDELAKLDKPWYKYGYLVKLNLLIFLVTLTSTNNGYDGSMLNGLQSLSSWQKAMSHPTGATLGALSNGNTFGAILSTVCSSYLSDKFGRKYTIMGGQFITIIGACLQGASTNYAFFLSSRFVIGFGSGIATIPSPSIISEISYPTHRPTATAFYNCCWYLGALIAAWVTYGTRTLPTAYSWKIPSYLQGAIPAIQIAFFFMVPESPRYLVSKGRVDEAEAILTKWHGGGSSDERALKLVRFEMKEIEAALESEKERNQTKYSDFLRIPSFRKRLFLCIFTATFMQLSGNGLISYYLNLVLNSIGITEEKKQLELNGWLMFFNLIVASVASSVASMFRRRSMFLLCIGLMLVFFVIWTALSAVNQQRNFEQKGLGTGVLAMIFLYYAAYDIGANGIAVLYVTEILPYSHRTKGYNIFNFWIQVVVLFNGFVNPIAMKAITWKYYIVYCCVLAVELTVVYFFYPETSGYSLEEVAQVFGDDNLTTINFVQQVSSKPEAEHIEVSEKV